MDVFCFVVPIDIWFMVLGSEENLGVVGGDEVSGFSAGSEELEAGGVDPALLFGKIWIDMVQLGRNCAGNCLSCGAFEGMKPSDNKVTPVTAEALKASLEREIEDVSTGTRARIIDLFRSYVTTGVDMEPLARGIFVEAAELIHRLSAGRSRLVAISHGLDCRCEELEGRDTHVPNEDQRQRLAKINELMLKDVVPLFVLTVDAAKQKGLPTVEAIAAQKEVMAMNRDGSAFSRIIHSQAIKDQKASGVPPFGEKEDLWNARVMRVRRKQLAFVEQKMNRGEQLSNGEVEISRYVAARKRRIDAVVEYNAQSVAATLRELLPAISEGKRVTLSLQGDPAEESLAYTGLSIKIQQRAFGILQENCGLDNAAFNGLVGLINVIATPRQYVPVGRGKLLMGPTADPAYCDVIPDPAFVKDEFYRDEYRVLRGKLTLDGKLEFQSNRRGRTYNDSVPGSLGTPPDNPWQLVDLSRARVNNMALPDGVKTFQDRIDDCIPSRLLTAIPAVARDERAKSLQELYPLSLIKDEGFRTKIAGRIRPRLKEMNFLDEDGETLLPGNFDLRRVLILVALIPEEEVREQGKRGRVLDDLSLRHKVASVLIERHCPPCVYTTYARERVGERGILSEGAEILAIQTLLEAEYGIKIDFEEEVVGSEVAQD